MNIRRATLFVTAAAVAASTFGLGVAAAAPSGPSPVRDVVRTLEADGYHVIVNRVGAGELSSCVIRSVQPGHTYYTTDSRGGSAPAVTVLAKTMNVDLVC